MTDTDDDPYEPLLERYRKELRVLYETLQSENKAAIKRVMDLEGIDEVAATEVLRTEGPLVHDGRVIHLIRKYWFEVVEINRKREALDAEWTAEPLTFLIDDLDGDDEEDLVDFLTQIAYWPIGLDENNDWS